MHNLEKITTFLKTDSSNQSSFFESQINADDVDYHGQIINVKKDIEREQKKMSIYTKVDQLNDVMKTLSIVIKDLDDLGIKTDGFQEAYYKLASSIKSIT